LDYWLSRPVDIFVLELGINDAIRGVAPSVTKQNLQQIINRVKAKHPQVKIALMGMQLPKFLAGSKAEAFSDIFAEIAGENHLPFVPFYLEGVAGKRHLNLQDGLHPSAEGYKIIADNVWPLIKSLL
jgi:acyl-CoA thioesterase-1